MENSQNSRLSKQDAIALLDAWLFVDGVIVQPTNEGTVNTTYFVKTQAGNFVFKLYNDSTTTAQIQYEHLLLTHLKKLNLSFAVPAPIPTASGETLLVVNRDDCSLRVALLPLILGNKSDRTNLTHTYAVGKALGELHHVLAGFDIEGQMAQLPAWGDLYHIHPLVPDPFEVPRLLELPLTQQQRVIKILTEVLEAAPSLYKMLPVQTTHADFLSPNVLLANNRVVGILDFEFATSDLRLIDYIAAVDHFTRSPGQEAPRWEFIKAFSTGYAEYISLSQLEVEALTLVWRLQQASCIVYWTGWLLERKVTYQSVLDGVARMLVLENWLAENTAQLMSDLAARFN
ncbi:phosphotransferase [Chlorogloeopsis sp. ULAP01]|uniref:phosphotransferase n=1 Tax=Chlorogloeopsis sp. ULAP01 TaxID=3056483 RepID=UPI0025AABA78|nr:phosphotransferase [Chlorogloeopsis sp. ULAP01]MDM9382291.1 phosphotransferase [Chlorogloeopsis sp. ULAP01]